MEKINIVIVEDEKIVAMDLEQRLINMGFSILGSFTSGDELISALPELEVDLLLMDINLEHGDDGIQTYEKIKKNYTIPVIFATAYSDHLTLSRAKKQGPYGYIVKPYDDQELFRTIDIGLYKFNMESELKEREEILRCIADSANDSIFMLDENENIIFWNKISENQFGYSYQEIYGTKWSDILFIENCNLSNSEGSQNCIFEIPDIKEKKTFNILAKSTEGHGVPMEMHVLPVEIKGKKRTICVIKDISTSLMKDAELKRTRVMAEISNHAKQIFLSNISHELRTPLNGIIGMAELLSETELSDEQKQYVDILQQSSSLLLETVNDILDLTKLETGKLELEYKRFSLKHIILKIVERYAYESRNKDLTINYTFDDSLPDYFIGDEFRVRQVVTNIVDNATKFTERGNVTIRADATMVRYEYNEPLATVCLTISDTGIGIHRKYFESIFDSFSQVDGAITRHFQGSGLGLNLVKRLVNIMNGHIEVDSVLGKGSEFKVVFDLVISTDINLTTDNSEIIKDDIDNVLVVEDLINNELEQINVLVAEDNLVGQKVISHILDHKNINYRIVNNGLEVLQALKEDNFDIIFMDIEMPELDGISTAIEIRKGNLSDIKSSIPIIALTGHSTSTDKERIIAAGMEDFLIKPIRIEEVYNKIKSVLFHGDENISIESTSCIVPEMFKGEEELYKQLVHVFIGDAQERINNIIKAYNSGNWLVVEKETHSLKGSASYVEATEITSTATILNNMIKNKEYSEIEPVIKNLNFHVKEFIIKADSMIDEVV